MKPQLPFLILEEKKKKERLEWDYTLCNRKYWVPDTALLHATRETVAFDTKSILIPEQWNSLAFWGWQNYMTRYVIHSYKSQKWVASPKRESICSMSYILGRRKDETHACFFFFSAAWILCFWLGMASGLVWISQSWRYYLQSYYITSIVQNFFTGRAQQNLADFSERGYMKELE